MGSDTLAIAATGSDSFTALATTVSNAGFYPISGSGPGNE